MTASAIHPPLPATLRRYGLTALEWRQMVREAGDRCPICFRSPPEVRLVTDHEHVRGFAKMSPAERRLRVRGQPCVRCNMKFLPVGLTSQHAERIVTYLRAYEEKSHLFGSKRLAA